MILRSRMNTDFRTRTPLVLRRILHHGACSRIADFAATLPECRPFLKVTFRKGDPHKNDPRERPIYSGVCRCRIKDPLFSCPRIRARHPMQEAAQRRSLSGTPDFRMVYLSTIDRSNGDNHALAAVSQRLMVRRMLWQLLLESRSISIYETLTTTV